MIALLLFARLMGAMIVMGIPSGLLTKRKGHGFRLGFCLGSFLGIIGLGIALCYKRKPSPDALIFE